MMSTGLEKCLEVLKDGALPDGSCDIESAADTLAAAVRGGSVSARAVLAALPLPTLAGHLSGEAAKEVAGLIGALADNGLRGDLVSAEGVELWTAALKSDDSVVRVLALEQVRVPVVTYLPTSTAARCIVQPWTTTPR
jgi:hypothetical protein